MEACTYLQAQKNKRYALEVWSMYWHSLAEIGACGRVARWYIFKPKITIWVNFWRALEWKSLAYSMTIRNITAIWYILCHLVI
jgi:hypothetical protein